MVARKRARKKSTATTDAKRAPSASPKRTTPWLLIGIAIAFIIIVGAIAYYRTPASAEGDIVASVNGEPVTQAWLDFQYNLLPAEYQAQLTREEALEQIINEELIIQAAGQEGIVVDDAAVNERVQQILAQNEMTIAQFEENLAMLNVTVVQFEQLIRRQLIISAYTSEKIKPVAPSERELRELYDLSADAFAVPEQVTVRHVLISSQRTNAAELAKEIYDAVRDGADICLYVENSTDDRGSRESCGEYTFQVGVMVPEFEQASFAMAPGDVRLVQTQFGYHIIKKITDVPAGVRSFEEVADLLREQYASAQQAQQYQAMIGQLRDAATITYGDGGEGLYTPPVETPEVEQEAEAEAEPTPLPPPPQEPAAPVQEESPAPIDVKACIAQKVTLYGTDWSADAQDGRAMFEGYPLTYISCDEGCDGIAGYPTWKAGDATLSGRASLEQLAELAGC